MVGLATLSKLNGVLGGLVLAGWVGLALVSAAFSRRAKSALAGGHGRGGRGGVRHVRACSILTSRPGRADRWRRGSPERPD